MRFNIKVPDGRAGGGCFWRKLFLDINEGKGCKLNIIWSWLVSVLIPDPSSRMINVFYVILGVALCLVGLDLYASEGDSINVLAEEAGLIRKPISWSFSDIAKICFVLILLLTVINLRINHFINGLSGSRCDKCGRLKSLQACGFISLREHQKEIRFEYQCECCSEWNLISDTDSPAQCRNCKQIGPNNFDGTLASGAWEGYKCKYCGCQLWIKVTRMKRNFGPNIEVDSSWWDWGDM